MTEENMREIVSEKTELSVSELIISYVREARPLWDIRDKLYHDNNEKTVLWTNISRALGIEVEVLKKKWKNLRDRFMKECRDDRGKSGQAAKRKKEWALYTSLHFLRDTVKPRLTTESVFPLSGCHNGVVQGGQSEEIQTVTLSGVNAAIVNVQKDLEQEIGSIIEFEDVPPSTENNTVGNNPFKKPQACAPLLIQTSMSSPQLCHETPSPTTSYAWPSPCPSPQPVLSPRSENSAHSSTSGETPAKRGKKNRDKDDPVDAAFLKFLQQRHIEGQQRITQAEQPKVAELSSDEHFYLHIAKESQSLSRVRRMRLRHAVTEKLLELVEEEENGHRNN